MGRFGWVVHNMQVSWVVMHRHAAKVGEIISKLKFHGFGLTGTVQTKGIFSSWFQVLQLMCCGTNMACSL
jgi:hypothetical protein